MASLKFLYQFPVRSAKPTRALKELNMVPTAVLEYGHFVETNLEAIFHHRLSAVPPEEHLIVQKLTLLVSLIPFLSLPQL